MSNNTENLTLLDLEAQLAETKEALRVLRGSKLEAAGRTVHDGAHGLRCIVA